MFGLVNARSLTNRTLIVRDFFLSRELTLTELLPNCYYFSSPWLLGGKGEGIGVIFKSDFKCQHICQQSSFRSFELCLFELGRSHIILVAVIYRPTKYNKDFLSDFSDCWAKNTSKNDCALIIGDIFICIYCPDDGSLQTF